MISNDFLKFGEYAASGAFEEPERSLFYRKALGIRRYYENCSLYAYSGEKLYPSGTKKETMRIFPHYLNGFSTNEIGATEEEKTMINEFKGTFFKYHSKVPRQHSVAGNMYCHSIPNYSRIIREGLDSYAERICNIKNRDIKDGLMHVYEGIRNYIARCIKYLEEIGAEKCLIDALKKVPLKKADNVYEAIVATTWGALQRSSMIFIMVRILRSYLEIYMTIWMQITDIQWRFIQTIIIQTITSLLCDA